jgi:hypothetical protein
VSQAAAEHGHAWDFCGIDTEQLGPEAPAIDDSMHACPDRSWADVTFVQTDAEATEHGLCAQLCLNPAAEFQAHQLDLIYGSTCVRDGFTRYVKTSRLQGHVLHWYGDDSSHAASDSPSRDDDPSAVDDASGPHGSRHGHASASQPPAEEREHKCEPNKLHNAFHLLRYEGDPEGLCQQICLNPAFKGPAGKRGVRFGSTCQELGYTSWIRQEKMFG